MNITDLIISVISSSSIFGILMFSFFKMDYMMTQLNKNYELIERKLIDLENKIQTINTIDNIDAKTINVDKIVSKSLSATDTVIEKCDIKDGVIMKLVTEEFISNSIIQTKNFIAKNVEVIERLRIHNDKPTHNKQEPIVKIESPDNSSDSPTRSIKNIINQKNSLSPHSVSKNKEQFPLKKVASNNYIDLLKKK
jgi:hypothetical protein